MSPGAYDGIVDQSHHIHFASMAREGAGWDGEEREMTRYKSGLVTILDVRLKPLGRFRL